MRSGRRRLPFGRGSWLLCITKEGTPQRNHRLPRTRTLARHTNVYIHIHAFARSFVWACKYTYVGHRITAIGGSRLFIDRGRETNRHHPPLIRPSEQDSQQSIASRFRACDKNTLARRRSPNILLNYLCLKITSLLSSPR